MKILVFSDSHGRREEMILAVMEQHPDAVFHLGDVLRDAEELAFAFPDLPLYTVPGNCDWFSSEGLPSERLVVLGGVKFMLCHGHVFGVKSGYYTAVDRARQAGADVLLCGHSHKTHYQDFGGLQLFNPGSVKDTRTYGVITVWDRTANCSVHQL